MALLIIFTMDIMQILRVSGSLAALGFLTALISALLISFSILSYSFGIALGVFLIVCSALLLFLAYYKNDDRTSRVNYWTVVCPSIVSAICLFAISDIWNIEASIINRSAIYIIVNFSLMGFLSLLWPFVTQKAISAELIGNNLNINQERTLYIWVNAFVSIIQGICVGVSEEGSISDLFDDSIIYTIGTWFLGAVVAALVGFLLVRKSQSSSLYDSVKSVPDAQNYD